MNLNLFSLRTQFFFSGWEGKNLRDFFALKSVVLKLKNSYFYVIFLIMKKKLPKFLQSALWSYHLNKMDITKDKFLIISHVLNYGNWEQIRWLYKSYSEKDIKSVFKNSFRGFWKEDVLNFWSIIFDLNIPEDERKKITFSLNVNQ